MFATPPPGIQVRPVLPDGIFSNQKSKFGYILEDPAFGDVGIRYGNFIHFTAKLYILWPFGTFCGHLVYFVVIWYILLRFGMLYREKSGIPGWDYCFFNLTSYTLAGFNLTTHNPRDTTR
jgi:hypothetical protein